MSQEIKDKIDIEVNPYTSVKPKVIGDIIKELSDETDDKLKAIATDVELSTQTTPEEDKKMVSRHGLIFWWNWLKTQFFVLRTFGLEKLSSPPSSLTEGQIWKEGNDIKVRLGSSITKTLPYTEDLNTFITADDPLNPAVEAYFAIGSEVNRRLYFGNASVPFFSVNMSYVSVFESLPQLSTRNGMIFGGASSCSVYRGASPDSGGNIYNASSPTDGSAELGGHHDFYVDVTAYTVPGAPTSSREFRVAKGFVEANRVKITNAPTDVADAVRLGDLYAENSDGTPPSASDLTTAYGTKPNGFRVFYPALDMQFTKRTSGWYRTDTIPVT